MAVKWKWKPAAGGSVSPELQNKVNQNETKINTIEQKYVKKDEANTFTAANTFNGQVAINSAAQDFTWETTRNWNQNIDNTVARTKDFKFVRKFEYTSVAQPNNNWNTTSWNWTLNNLNSQNGIHEFLVVISIEDVAYNFNPTIVWKSGLNDSQSPLFILEHGDTTYHFKIVVKGGNKFHIYTRKLNGTKNIQWVRAWIVRDNNLPWKANELW